MSDSPNVHYATPDPEYAALFATMPPRDPFPVDVSAGRKVLAEFFAYSSQAVKSHLPDESKYRVVDHSVPVSDGTATIVVRTITPTSEGLVPCLYWVHGGGFALGSIDQFEFSLRILSVEMQLAVALVEYRLAPEHPHPIPLNDCFDGLKWVGENAASFGADLSKGFLVAGDSAGGCLTASIAHLARDDPFFHASTGRSVTGQILQIPCVVHPRGYPEKYKAELRSIDATENIDIINSALSREFVFTMYDLYLKASPTDPGASPLLYPSHTNLAPALVQISGLDPLRDEGILYAKVLQEAGVPTRRFVYPGLPHGFHIIHPQLQAAKKWEEDLRDGIRWLLLGGGDGGATGN